MSGLDKTGTRYPTGINVDKGEFFIDGVPVKCSAAELNGLTASAMGTANFEVLKKAGTAANGAIVFTSQYTIGGFIAQGFTTANAPIAIGTAVVSGKTLTITPSSGGVATDNWYVQVWV